MTDREKWVDYVKLFACVLVTMGHFFKSMVESQIIPQTPLCNWFITAIYYFHVPLFFICSGYLYQKKASVNTFVSWKSNVKNKAVALGIPYFVFSLVTWVMKAVFSGSVNTQNESLLVSLFLKPISPYWYLYALFFLFLIMPNFANRKHAVWAVFAAIVLNFSKVSGVLSSEIYAVSYTMEYLIWFVLGMCMQIFAFPHVIQKIWKPVALVCGGAFLMLTWINWDTSAMKPLVMGLLACVCVILTVHNLPLSNRTMQAIDLLSGYTMAIYLMHTIFAAGIRVILMKIAVASPLIHMVVGIASSFIGPVLAAEIMKRTKLDFFMYPGKYVKMRT